MADKLLKAAKKMYKPGGATSTKGFHRPEGAGNFDNMDDYNIVDSITLNTGTIQHTPSANKDILNKEFGDANYGPGTETDPVFLSLSGSFITAETDPVWLNQSGSFVTLTGVETLTNKTIDDFSNQIEADEVHEELRNESGDAMTRGDAVFISGFSVGQVRALVTLADNEASSTMPAVAILEDSSLANNATGHFIEIGSLTDMDTSDWTTGDELYISGSTTTGNTLTNIKPTSVTAAIQRVAVVLRSHASNGVIEIFGAGRENDSPNTINIPGDVSGSSVHVGSDPVLTSFTETDPVFISLSGSLLKDSGDTATGEYIFTGHLSGSAISGSTIKPLADHTTSGSSLAVGIITHTSDTPPTASNFPQGTIYVQYTA